MKSRIVCLIICVLLMCLIIGCTSNQNVKENKMAMTQKYNVKENKDTGYNKSLNSDDSASDSLDDMKCEYIFEMVKNTLISSPGTDYASIYDGARITDQCGNWYEIRFTAEVYQVMSRLTSAANCYAWVYIEFDFENTKLIDVKYESFANAPYKYFYIMRKSVDEVFSTHELETYKERIEWGKTILRSTSSEISLWGTVHSNEYHTDFWLDESVLVQIGKKHYDVSRIDIEDPYLFPTLISGKPIQEYNGQHLFLTGTITNASEDFSLVKFYELREGVMGSDTPYIDDSSVYQIEVKGTVQYNEKTELLDIVLHNPIELTAINGYTSLTEKVRVWPVDYAFSGDNIMNYVGEDVQIQGLIDYELGVFSIRPTSISSISE